jgi:hypothetical protein
MAISRRLARPAVKKHPTVAEEALPEEGAVKKEKTTSGKSKTRIRKLWPKQRGGPVMASAQSSQMPYIIMAIMIVLAILVSFFLGLFR